MSLVHYERRPEAASFPRVSGDEPSQGVGGQLSEVFSPRERG